MIENIIMDILKNLKLDKWWGVVLYLGVIFSGSALYFDTNFLEEKHLFGMGLGMILIGISFFSAEKHYTGIKPPNAYTGPVAYITSIKIEHNILTIILSVTGFVLLAFFGFLIIKGLI